MQQKFTSTNQHLASTQLPSQAIEKEQIPTQSYGQTSLNANLSTTDEVLQEISDQKIFLQQEEQQISHIVTSNLTIENQNKALSFENVRFLVDSKIKQLSLLKPFPQDLKKEMNELQNSYEVKTIKEVEERIKKQFDEIEELKIALGEQQSQDVTEQMKHTIKILIQLIAFIQYTDNFKLSQEDELKFLRFQLDQIIQTQNIKSLQIYQKTTKEALNKAVRFKEIFEKKGNQQKVNEQKANIKKYEQNLKIYQRYMNLNKKIENKVQDAIKSQQNKQKKKITFKIMNLSEKKIIQYQLYDNHQSLLEKLELINATNLQILIFSNQKEKYIALEKGQSVENVVEDYINCKGMVKQLFTVMFQDEEFNFIEETDLQKIKKTLGNENSQYNFYDQSLKKVRGDNLISNVKMREIASNVCLMFGGTTFENTTVPIDVPFAELIKYINFTDLLKDDIEIERKSFFESQSAELFFRYMQINSKQYDLCEHQANSIKQVSKGKVKSLKLSFKLNILITLTSRNNSRQINFVANSDDTIEILKKQFVDISQLEYQKQQWKISNQQLRNEDTLIDKKIYRSHLRIDVEEIQNLQYYGFSQIKPIKSNLFINYSIQDDETFIQRLKKSNFPQEKFQYSFRILCLRIIFSAIKKHCKIQSAITHIMFLISKVTFVQKQKLINNILKDKLWLSPSKNEISRFNQFYVLHNILLSSQSDLRISLMSTYKNHSPLFLKTIDQKCNRVDYSDEHFWINNKSFVITSIQIKKARNIAPQLEGHVFYNGISGKSTALNLFFEANFQEASHRHSICSRSVVINYNVYRNDDIKVDLIDVSTNSISEDEKVQLCRASNMVIIHYIKDDIDEVQEWIKLNYGDKPVILFERDNDGVMDNINQFQAELQTNNSNPIKKKYTLPKMTQSNLSHYQNKIPQITNQIHRFIQQCHNQRKDQWLFLNYLAKKNQVKLKVINILKEVQINFSSITNMKLLSKSPNQIDSDQISKILSQTTINILDVLQLPNTGNFFEILREFIKLLRAQRMKPFSSIQKLQKIFESKDQSKISELSDTFNELINQLEKINKQAKTQQFEKILEQMKEIKIFNRQNIVKLDKKAEDLNRIFNYEIKLREFSIQNFWRGLYLLFHESIKVPQALENYKNKVKNLFSKDFNTGKTFEVINGDNLQMPINLFKGLEDQLLNNKRVIIIGIFGPQSSGKSTLLNYLFGCDFASSDGRCTSGVYGTYYEVDGGVLKCDGIFILDTEGLFSNYVRPNKKAVNFDNKLVLFLIRACDIVILNTRGDVDKNCEQILEVSFDSELMENKNGAIYPHFYMVLNQNASDINATQTGEVIKLTKKIIAVKQEMEKYMNSSQAQSMPLAFNVLGKKVNSQILRRIQVKSKIPTDEFYKKTKDFSLQLIKTIQKRNPRALIDAFDQMNAIWRNIVNNPNLTLYKSKFLKQEDQRMDKQIYGKIQKNNFRIDEWSKYFPQKLLKLQQYEKQKEKDFVLLQEQVKNQFKNENPNRANEDVNQIIKKYETKLLNNLKNSLDAFKLKLSGKKMKVCLVEFQKRGIYQVMNAANELKRMQQKGQDISLLIEPKFETQWNNYVKLQMDNIQAHKVAQQKFKEAKDCYQNMLNLRITSKIKLNFNSSAVVKAEILDIKDYSHYILKMIQQENRNDFHSYYSPLQMQPIITTKSQASSITGKYLKMCDFFENTKIELKYYLKVKDLNQIILHQSIAREVHKKLLKSDSIISYVQDLKEDLAKFNVKIKDENKVLENIIQNYMKIINIQSGKNYYYQDRLSKLHPNCLQLDQSKNILGGDGFIWKNTCGLFKDYLQKFYKKKQNYNFGKQDEKLKVLWTQMFIHHIAFELKFKQCKPSAILTNAIRSSIYSYCFQNSQVLQFQYLEAYNSLIPELNHSLKTLGFSIKQQKSKFDHLKSGQVKFNYQLQEDLPVYYNLYRQLEKVIEDGFIYLDRYKIKKRLTQFKTDNCILIANVAVERLGIKQVYKNQKIIEILKNYLNKDYNSLVEDIKKPEFKKNIAPHIKKFQIFQKILQLVQKQEASQNVQDIIRHMMNPIDKEITDFNQDLKQISHCISPSFIIQIHNFTVCLIAKKLQICENIKSKETKIKLQAQRIKQKQNFMNKLDMKKKHKANAIIFISEYQEFLRNRIRQAKQAFITTRKDIFLSQNKREIFQRKVEEILLKSKSMSDAYDYLINQNAFLQKQYKILVNKQIETHFVKFKYQETQIAIDEFKQSVANIYQEMKILNDLEEECQKEWDAMCLFSKYEGKERDQIQLKNVFLELIKNNNLTQISSKYKNNKFNLDAKYVFKKKIQFQKPENLQFIKYQIDTIDFQISNYYMFMKELNKQLLALTERIKDELNFNDLEKSKHRNGINLQFCSHSCSFCGRYCDIDLKQHQQNPNKKHQCAFGHQPRAIKQISLELTQNKVKTNYGSVYRCERIQQNTKILFNGQERLWSEHKLTKSDWSFEDKNKNSSYALFQNLWGLAGQKICSDIQTKQKSQFKYITLDDFNQKLNSIQQQQCHYIFALDGSGSMTIQDNWNTQKNEVRKILCDLRLNSRNRVSIIVWDTSYVISFEAVPISKVDIDQIPFPQGGTRPACAFKACNQIISRRNQKQNVHFIYTSDGDGDLPLQEINTLLAHKRRVQSYQCKFNYTSIGIGNESKQFMDQINIHMKGNAAWCPDSSSISTILREIIKGK